MAKPLPKKRHPHTPDCNLNNPKVEKVLRSSCTCGGNPLDADDFSRIGLPRHLWGADISKVPSDVREKVSNYLKNLLKAKESGGSLFLYGKPGVGKTGTGAVVLKEARAWGFTAYAITLADLREAVRAHASFDFEASIYERCRSVDFLLLDDVRETDIAEKFFTLNDTRGLLLSRQDRGLVTVVTSVLDLQAWRKLDCAALADALYKSCITLEVTGPDLRKAVVAAKNELLK